MKNINFFTKKASKIDVSRRVTSKINIFDLSETLPPKKIGACGAGISKRLLGKEARSFNFELIFSKRLKSSEVLRTDARGRLVVWLVED